MADLVRKKFKVVPGFLLKYKFTTNKFITYVKSPVIIFHGDADEVIYLGSSIKLKELFKPGDKLIVLNDQGHNGINSNPEYRKEIKVLLN